jgi:uncharacterized membrane protein YqjE
MSPIPSGTPDERPTEESVGDSLRSIAASLAGYLHARILLLKIESREASDALLRRGFLLGYGWSFLFLAYALGIAGGISLLAEGFETRWEFVALLAAGVHLILGAVLLTIARTKLSHPFFEATLNEFEKDRQWLGKDNDQQQQP